MGTDSVSSLRQRMIEDMNARKLCAGTQRGHIHSCKRFAAFLRRSPDTAAAEDIRRFQLHLSETTTSISNRNRIMTGLRFLFRVTLRRLDLAAEIYHLRQPQKIPLVMSQDETRRLLAVASSLKVRVLLSLGYPNQHIEGSGGRTASKLVFFCSLGSPLGEKFVAVSNMKDGLLGSDVRDSGCVAASVSGELSPMLAPVQGSAHRGPLQRQYHGASR
jgi:Phage integrase, N-terminal SAM-like domain